ncbi:hypothetical protein PtB15_6B403 [Puccinia triticina]|nr:hypothetical protein PtB15_6B403 [Puccinia triticina]
MLAARRGRSSKVPAVDANTSLSHPEEPIKVPRDDATAPLLPTQAVTSVKRGHPRKEYEWEHDGQSNDLLLSLLKESAPPSTSHHATPTQKPPLTE